MFIRIPPSNSTLKTEDSITSDSIKKAVMTPCGHIFDKDSVVKWIKLGKKRHNHFFNQCPLCNVKISEISLKPTVAVQSVVKLIEEEETKWQKKLDDSTVEAKKTTVRLISKKRKNIELKTKLSEVSATLTDTQSENTLLKDKLTRRKLSFFAKKEILENEVSELKAQLANTQLKLKHAKLKLSHRSESHSGLFRPNLSTKALFKKPRNVGIHGDAANRRSTHK